MTKGMDTQFYRESMKKRETMIESSTHPEAANRLPVLEEFFFFF